MATINLREITKKVGARLLFENITVTFNALCRYGLTGPNGAGKSTLLKIIMGLEEATSGSVSLPRKVGFLKQNIEHFRDQKVLDVVIMGNQRLWDAFSRTRQPLRGGDDRRGRHTPGRTGRDHQ